MNYSRTLKRIKMLKYLPGKASKLIFYSGKKEEIGDAIQEGITPYSNWEPKQYNLIEKGFCQASSSQKRYTKPWYKTQ